MKSSTIGTPSAANDAIGGVPQFYYYDFASKGRGEVIRLFFEDAEIAFVDHRFSFDEYNSKTVEERAKINPTGSLPYIELNEKLLTQSYPVLRYLARELGKYDGKTSEEKYFADVICDQALDWRTRFVDGAFATTKEGLNPAKDSSAFDHHKDYLMPRYVRGIEKHLAESPYSKTGPFTLGAEITYADFVLYQIYHDERELGGPVTELLEKEAPTLKKLVEAVEARPKIAEYFKSDRYFG